MDPLQLHCCPRDRSLFPDNTEEFIHKTSSSGLRDWILSNRGWIAASMKRRKDGDSGPIPIINWLANHEGNTQAILKQVRENRRRRILREQDRKEREQAAKKRKEQQNNPDKRHRLTTYFKSTGKTKTKRTTKYKVMKQHENDSRKKERRREQPHQQSSIRAHFSKVAKQTKKVKNKIVSSIQSLIGRRL